MMDKIEIFNHFSELLDNLIIDFNFFKYYLQEPYSLDEDIYPSDWNYEDLIFYNGATRACLLDKNFPYVIKFNLCNFESCEFEEEIYSKANHCGLEKYFEELFYVGTYERVITFPSFEALNEYSWSRFFWDEKEFNEILELVEQDYFSEIKISIPLYAARRGQKVKFDYNFFFTPSSEVEKERFNKSPLIKESPIIAENFIKNYGTEEFFKLSDFLTFHRINDLHSDNVMFFEDGLKISDYAGYYD